MSDMVHSVLEDRIVSRPATPEETVAAATQLVGAMSEEEQAEDDAAEDRKFRKEQIERIRGRIHGLKETIENGVVRETRQVTVTYDAARASVTVRDGDGTVVEERAMTAEELDDHRQLDLAPAPPPDNVEDFPSAPTPHPEPDL